MTRSGRFLAEIVPTTSADCLDRARRRTGTANTNYAALDWNHNVQMVHLIDVLPISISCDKGTVARTASSPHLLCPPPPWSASRIV